MKGTALEIQDLRIEYTYQSTTKIAVDRLSLKIEEGEFFALLGPNGAGKTSVISAITGLVPYQSGEIRVFGNPAGSRQAKFLLGLVPQELVSYGFFTVDEVLHFHSGYYGIRDNRKKIDELLDRLQLTTYRKKLVAQLSGGLKRRFLIAKALLHSPRLLLLDEPSAGVDVELRTILWNFAQELNRQGTTIVLTTHYLEEAERLCRRAAIMDNGKILALDETGSLISSMAERVIHFTLKNFQVREAAANNLPFSQEGNHLKAVVNGSMSLHEVIESLRIPLENILDIRTEEGDLENAFLNLIKTGGGSSRRA